MGLWDSINSVGVFYDRIFPYVSHTNIVKHIRHAISIDERRGKFKQYPFFPNIAKLTQCRSDNHNQIDINFPVTATSTSNTSLSSCVGGTSDKDSISRSLCSSVPSWSPDSDTPSPSDTIWSELLDTPGFNEITDRDIMGYFTSRPIAICDDVCELWFPGDHSDVGGGWALSSEGQGLCNVSLRWMLAEAYKAGCLFRDGALSDFDVKYPLISSLRSPLHDSLYAGLRCNKNERIHKAPSSLLHSTFWWALEYLPIFSYKLNPFTDRWTKTVSPNLGSRRTIPINVKFHWSVAWRMKFLEYGPSSVSPEHDIKEWDGDKSENDLDDLKRLIDGNPRI